MDPYWDEYARELERYTDEQLENVAEGYIWQAEFQPSEVGRYAFGKRRDSVVAECERRGRKDIADRGAGEVERIANTELTNVCIRLKPRGRSPATI